MNHHSNLNIVSYTEIGRAQYSSYSCKFKQPEQHTIKKKMKKKLRKTGANRTRSAMCTTADTYKMGKRRDEMRRQCEKK